MVVILFQDDCAGVLLVDEVLKFVLYGYVAVPSIISILWTTDDAGLVHIYFYIIVVCSFEFEAVVGSVVTCGVFFHVVDSIIAGVVGRGAQMVQDAGRNLCQVSALIFGFGVNPLLLVVEQDLVF